MSPLLLGCARYYLQNGVEMCFNFTHFFNVVITELQGLYEGASATLSQSLGRYLNVVIAGLRRILGSLGHTELIIGQI